MKEIFAALIVLVFTFGLLYMIFILPFFGLDISTGSGEHTGYVTAVERNGVIWKTPTVYFKTELESSQEDMYCADESLVEELEQKAISQEKITLEYISVIAFGLTECNREGAKITSLRK